MARKNITGLHRRGEIWHIDKQVKGFGRLCESTGTCNQEEAERYLIHRLEEIRNATVYGVRSVKTWRQAATRYLLDNTSMPSIGLTAIQFDHLDPFIGDLRLDRIHDGTLAGFIQRRKDDGVKNRTINVALERVIRVLNLAAKSWRDEHGMTWLETAPMITKLDEKTDKRPPYHMSWDEQEYLLRELPAHLQAMALFKVNTGTREQEVCKLEWAWECAIPEISGSVFVVPADFGGRSETSGVKNGEDRVVVLNDAARRIIDRQRGKHHKYVFTYHEAMIDRMNASAWRKARRRAAKNYAEDRNEPVSAGFYNLRVHDLKHTFGRRLRAAGVSFEDRQVLLGHTNGSVTTHYSAAEIGNLVSLANKVSNLV